MLPLVTFLTLLQQTPPLARQMLPERLPACIRAGIAHHPLRIESHVQFRRGIKAGEGFYSAVIIPPLTFIPENTLSVFEKFANNGGLLINLSDYRNSGVLKSEVKTLEEIPRILEREGLLDVCLLKKIKI